MNMFNITNTEAADKTIVNFMTAGFSIRGCDYLSTSLHVSFLVFTQAVRVFESWYGNVALQTKALVLDMQNVNKMAIMATVTQT